MVQANLYRIIVKSPEDFSIGKIIEEEVNILKHDRILDKDRYFVSATSEEISDLRKKLKKFRKTTIIIKRVKSVQ